MIVLGVTGGVGAGKSAILEYIRQNYSSRIILADDVAKSLMEPNSSCYDTVKQEFGDYEVFDENGFIIKPKMAELIFKNPSLRDKINSIIHPAVKNEIITIISDENKHNKLDIIIVEAALAIEGNFKDFCDYMVYIYTSEDNRKNRLKESRGYSDQKISEIMSTQLTEEEFRKACDFVIDNNNSKEQTFEAIDKILKDTFGLSVTKE